MILGKGGMNDKVQQSEDKLKKLKDENKRQKQIYGIDINKMGMLVDKIEYKK